MAARAGAVLYAKAVGRVVAFYSAVTVCDGLDPEGHVIRLREHAG